MDSELIYQHRRTMMRDGKTDIAVFRNGTWYVQRSTQGFTGVAFGNPTDKPVPNAFVP
ncbi:MAG: hypothetical protein WKF71_04710 [Pyrinomonadaceae bacterium]